MWDKLESDPGLRVIHLVRKDMLRTLVSRAVAGATNEWMRVSKQAPDDNRERIHVDEEWFRSQIQKTMRWQEDTQARFRSHPFLEVSYEDLVADLQGTFGRITAHLGLDPIVPVAKQRRQGSDDLDQVIDNQDVLRSIAAQLATKS